jgi:hypothetical protein
MTRVNGGLLAALGAVALAAAALAPMVRTHGAARTKTAATAGCAQSSRNVRVTVSGRGSDARITVQSVKPSRPCQ